MNWACLNSVPCNLSTRLLDEDQGGLCEDEMTPGKKWWTSDVCVCRPEVSHLRLESPITGGQKAAVATSLQWILPLVTMLALGLKLLLWPAEMRHYGGWRWLKSFNFQGLKEENTWVWLVIGLDMFGHRTSLKVSLQPNYSAKIWWGWLIGFGTCKRLNENLEGSWRKLQVHWVWVLSTWLPGMPRVPQPQMKLKNLWPFASRPASPARRRSRLCWKTLKNAKWCHCDQQTTQNVCINTQLYNIILWKFTCAVLWLLHDGKHLSYITQKTTMVSTAGLNLLCSARAEASPRCWRLKRLKRLKLKGVLLFRCVFQCLIESYRSDLYVVL